jgi:uncharacterized protein YcbK (DUF882 family)
MWRVIGVLLALYGTTFSSLAMAPDSAPLESATNKKRTVTHGENLEPLLATLVNVHTHEVAMLTASRPTALELRTLLHDRATGAEVDFDPRLLPLLRALTVNRSGARVEIVSGFRSPKLNEIMRKKGHHVASHSQHSLGHAIDFRIIPRDAAPEGTSTKRRAIDPRDIEKEVRALGWDGGTGVYTQKSDWFIHCDVGRKRNW